MRLRRMICFFLCFISLTGSASAEIIPIPWDQEIMDEVNEQYYIGEREYQDPSLHVTIEEGIFHDTSYLVARVKIAHPTQLRSYVTENRNLNKYPKKYGTELADMVNAVFAISGDVMNLDKSKAGSKTGKHITRNFETWLTNAKPDKKGEGILDILIIDTDGNLTIIPRGADLKDVSAFDTGPGNMVIDQLTEIVTEGKQHYDADGKLALAGQVSSALLSWMMEDPYLSALPPKTTGREAYGDAYISRFLSTARELNVSAPDMITTATAFTAETIRYAMDNFCHPRPE